MENEPDLSQLSTEELLVILRRTDHVNYAAVMRELEGKKHISDLLKIEAPKPKDSVLLNVLQLINLFIQLIIFVAGIVAPFTNLLVYTGTSSEAKIIMFIMSTLYTFGLYLMAAVGFYVMRHSLRSLHDQAIAKIGLYAAVCFAPVSGFLYMLLSIKLSVQYGWLITLLGVMGYYIPFVLIALWMKYKYREDQF